MTLVNTQYLDQLMQYQIFMSAAVIAAAAIAMTIGIGIGYYMPFKKA